MKIYVAAPFFNDKELINVELVAKVLEDKGHTLFIPMEETKNIDNSDVMKWRKGVFKADTEGIIKADLVLAVVNHGNYDDMGTCWEMGYAYALDIPVVIFKTDVETTLNLMASESAVATLVGIEELLAYDFEKLEPIIYKGDVF